MDAERPGFVHPGLKVMRQMNSTASKLRSFICYHIVIPPVRKPSLQTCEVGGR